MTGRDDITLAAAKLVERASRTSTMVALAESCTGGMVAAAITDIPGASQVLACGFVVYANDAKTSQLGVSADTIAAHGAVSRETATQMAEGALRATPLAGLAVSVTGIAGPDGGTADKPVGLVWFGVARCDGETVTMRHFFEGDREAVRVNAARVAIEALVDALAPR